MLLLAHTGRDAARDVTLAFCKALTGHGLLVRMLEEEAADLELDSASYDPPLELVGPDTDAGADCEIAVVVGGDGSILRAAEVTWSSGTPVLGVNLGHVGFLAEAEPDDVEATIEAIVQRTWTPEDRLTLDVRAYRDGELVTHTFALNEASVEKAARERMIEVVIEIDNRPLSRWGCDGVVLSTPTGSTAYNFSAGGPVVWPGVEALVVVPISAHALFARPMVVAPDSVVAVEVIARTDGVGRALVRRPTAGGPAAGRPDRGTPRRAAGPPGPPAPGAVHRPAGRQVRPPGRRVARLRRAPAPRRGRSLETEAVLEEIRISQLGVIDSSTLELGPGLTVITGETGAGKTMVVTALGLLLGARADSGAVRSGARAARVEGVVDATALGGFAEAVDEAGGEVEDGRVVLARNLSAEGRSRAFVGGASVPVTRLAEVTEVLVAVHGQSDQHRLLQQRAQREALDRFGGEPLDALLAAYADLYRRLKAAERELDEVSTQRAGAGPRGRSPPVRSR